jgi:hypothetical protein
MSNVNMANADRTFDVSPPCSATQESLVVGRQAIPWSAIEKFGVSYQRDPRFGGAAHYLHFAYREVSAPKSKEMLVLLPSHDHPLVKAVHERIPHAWLGTHGYFSMRKQLGFSNKAVFMITAVIILLAFVATGIIVWSVTR